MTELATRVEVLPALPEGSSQLVLDLGDAGQITRTGLVLTNEHLSIERWLELGRAFGDMYRVGKWALGDWLVFGEAVYGENDEWAQGVDAVPAERYDVAHRVTGLEPTTLGNIASVCRRVPRLSPDGRLHRREELSFEHHAEVAKLDLTEQAKWLNDCVEKGWTRSQLREEIAGPVSPLAEPLPGTGDPGKLTVAEQMERALRLVWNTMQRAEDGSGVIPSETVAQVAAALGEE